MHLWRFADNADGYMDEIHLLRDRFQADVAILMVDDADGCGQATRVGADEDEALPSYTMPAHKPDVQIVAPRPALSGTTTPA